MTDEEISNLKVGDYLVHMYGVFIVKKTDHDEDPSCPVYVQLVKHIGTPRLYIGWTEWVERDILDSDYELRFNWDKAVEQLESIKETT